MCLAFRLPWILSEHLNLLWTSYTHLSLFRFFFSGLPFVCPKYYTCHRYLHQQTMTTDCFQQLSLRQSCSTVSEFGLESNKDYVEVLPGKSSKPKQHGQLSPLQLCTDTSLARLLAFQIPTDLGEGSRSEVD